VLPGQEAGSYRQGRQTGITVVEDLLGSCAIVMMAVYHYLPSSAPILIVIGTLPATSVLVSNLEGKEGLTFSHRDADKCGRPDSIEDIAQDKAPRVARWMPQLQVLPLAGYQHGALPPASAPLPGSWRS